jgi:hypothetical protein
MHKGGLVVLMHFRENRFQLLCNDREIIIDGHRFDVSQHKSHKETESVRGGITWKIVQLAKS